MPTHRSQRTSPATALRPSVPLRTPTDRALCMVAADARYRSGDESAVVELDRLITDVLVAADCDDVYDTICALIQLVADAERADGEG